MVEKKKKRERSKVLFGTALKLYCFAVVKLYFLSAPNNQVFQAESSKQTDSTHKSRFKVPYIGPHLSDSE